MNADKDKLDSLTERVLDAVFEVTNTLGAGFLEKVYQRALLRELGLRGIRATAEASFTVTYKSHSVGEYFADLLVEDVLVVELKCVERLSSEHTAQCLNYLRASGRTVCLLVNFQNPRSSGSVSSIGFRISKPIEAPVGAESTQLGLPIYFVDTTLARSLRLRTRRIAPMARFIATAHDHALGVPPQARPHIRRTIAQRQPAAPACRLIGFRPVQQQI